MGVLDATASGTKFGIIGTKFETWPPPSNAFRVPNPQGPPKIRQSVYTALELRKEQNGNKDFLRTDGNLYIVAFTDKSDATDMGSDGIPLAEFNAWLDTLAPSASARFAVFTTASKRDYWLERAHNAIVYDAGGFPAGMEQIILDAVGQTRTFVLNYTPTAPPPIAQVVYHEHGTNYELDVDYTYDPETNSITFEKVLPRVGSSVRVVYLTLDEVITTTTTTDETETTESTGDTSAETDPSR
jgi:hypothetical protein